MPQSGLEHLKRGHPRRARRSAMTEARRHMPDQRTAIRRGRIGFSVCVALALSLTALLVPGMMNAVEAHPHIWVNVRTTVLYENGAIVGLRHAWTFDEYYTAMAIDGLDTNKDGVYSREELAELAKINVEALKEFGYFTFPKLKGHDIAVGVPKDYYLEHTDRKDEPAAAAKSANDPVLPRAGAEQSAGAAKPAKELTLHFTLPLAKPVLADAEGFTFSLGDPSFFIAFEPAATDPATLGNGAPKGCRIESLAPPAVADANPSKPGDLMAGQPADPTVNFVSGPAWQIMCKPGG